MDDAVHRKAALNIHDSFIVQAPAGSGKTTLLTQRVLALLAGAVREPEECLCITFTQKAAAEMRERVLLALEYVSLEYVPLEYVSSDRGSASDSGRDSDSDSDSDNDRGRDCGSDRAATHLDETTRHLAEKVLQRDTQLGWDLLNNPNRLRIQTIDSLCAELTQRMPLQSGLGSAVKITETPEIFYQEAASHVLTAVESNEPWAESIKILLQHLDNDWEVVLNLLADMLSHRDQWLLSLGPTFFKKPDRRQLEKSLQTVILSAIKETISALLTLPSEHAQQLLSLAQFAGCHLGRKGLDVQTPRQNSLNQDLPNQDLSNQHLPHQHLPHQNCANQNWPTVADLKDLSFWQGIANLLFTDANQLRKTVTEKQGFPSQQSSKNKEEKALFKCMKESMQQLLAALCGYPQFCTALQAIQECPPPQYTDSQWRVVQALLITLPVLVAELMLSFQKKGEVDFIEIALSAHQALGDKEHPTDLALKLGYHTKHILVDEFQDTSLSQFLLLEKLTLTWSPYEGNTLFLVGDPMQSIYRFRRADVSLFIQAKLKGIHEFRLKPLSLSSNFRSQAPIVDWVNKQFARVFPKQEDAHTGAVQYTPAKAHQTTKTQAVTTAFEVTTAGEVTGAYEAVSAYETPKTQEETAEVIMHSVTEELEADKIVKCIYEVQENHSGSIALLVRSRSHLQLIIPALEKHHISYQGVELERLSARPIIQDLLSLFRALIHLGDRIAWLALLRSPYIGIPLEDLEKIAIFQLALPIFWSLEHYEEIKDLKIDTKHRLKRVLPVLANALMERERLGVSIWLQQAWKQLYLISSDREHQAENYQGENDTDIFFKILRETAKNQDVYSLGLLEQKINEHFASPLFTDKNAVQIMTIHKAKGLEFDTVLLAGLGRKERSDSMRLLLWEEKRSEAGDPYLLLAPIRSSDIKKDAIYEYLRKQEQKRARYENLRLLYVAATRAKKRLYGFLHNEDLFVENS